MNEKRIKYIAVKVTPSLQKRILRVVQGLRPQATLSAFMADAALREVERLEAQQAKSEQGDSE